MDLYVNDPIFKYWTQLLAELVDAEVRRRAALKLASLGVPSAYNLQRKIHRDSAYLNANGFDVEMERAIMAVLQQREHMG